MKPHAITALVAVAGAGAGAGAQNTVTYGFSFNGGGNVIGVLPGEAVNVVVTATLSSFGGGTTSPWGLADGGWSISGNATPGFSGSWSNLTVPAPYNFLYGIATTAGMPAGNSVNGAIFGTGAPWIVPVPPAVPGAPITNPDDVWSGTYTVGLVPGTLTLGFTGSETTNVWIGSPLFLSSQAWQNVGTTGTINVVPAPAGLVLLGLGGLTAVRRRRRR